MKIGRKNYSLCFVIIALFFYFATVQTQTTVSEASFTYDDTDFVLFSTSLMNQPDAQTECLAWGGNLATIKSAVEDSLLLYSSPDLNTIFTCHIGLNDIDTEAGTNGDDFVWIDYSTSSYRNWGTLYMDYPITTVNYDCVRNRYRIVVISQGWVNDPCTATRNCYFCSKPGTSNGCDLTYDGSCYNVFEVSTPINWLDAQSSCAIWGGDLTSITTERENNYLNTLITSSVGNCWIGLNDRDDDGIYTWIDGTAVSYKNWTGTPPNAADSDCVQINNTGNGIWEFVSCDITLDAMLCKRDSPNTIPTGARFGRITNGGLEFEALTGNTFFYEPLTLVCGSDGSAVEWRYSQNSNLYLCVLTENSNYVDFSWLYVNNTMQGYYQCMISDAISHTVGVYDKTLTTVAVTGTSYTYIVGVDRTDVLLLCDPEDGGSLSTLRWSVQNGMEFFNPINLNSESSNLPDVSTTFSCKRGGDTLTTTLICVKVPTISISYGVVPVTSYSSVYPAMNGLSVPSAVQDITLSINIEGKWTLPDNTESTNPILTITNFSSQNNGVYKFYSNNWDNIEVCAIQIILSGDPDTQITYNDTVFGYFTTPVINWYTAQQLCLNWGGNLATIKSAIEDSLLFYSIPYLNTTFACYIGLNDIENEAGTDGSAFVWRDGSTSSYRNWGDIAYPVVDDNYDCVRFRYRDNSGVLSQGWANVPCNIHPRNCYFCNKPGVSNGCDLTYNSSCYKVFEVSTPINWLDAQSSCAIWGGDLTSITTERENNYLNTLITSSVGNCWIGLNDRDAEGTYTWIDGTKLDYTNWTSSTSDNSIGFCVKIMYIDNSYWYPVNCEETSNTFVCKRPSNIPITVQFGQLVNGGLDFQVLQNGTILEGSLALACRGDEASETQWIYSQNLDLSNSQEISATFNIQTGLSWLKVEDSKQGVYKCQINITTSYMIVLYRQIFGEILLSNTPTLLDYTVGSVQILYYTNDIKGSIKWTPNVVKDGDTEPYSKEFPNPVEMSTVFSDVGTGVHTMTVFYRMSPVTLIGSVELAIKDTVEVTISYGNFTHTTSDFSNQLFPLPQEIIISAGTRNIKFTCNMSNCKWKFEDKHSQPGVFVEPYNIDILAEDNEGIYSLVRNTPTGEEYLTARVYINVPTSLSIALIGIATIPIIIIICLIVVMILIIICVWKRRTPSPFAKQKLKTGTPTKQEYTNKAGTQEHNNQIYLELNDIVETNFTNTNPQYMTIDESSMVPMELEYQQKQREYQNLANVPMYAGPYEEIPETGSKASTLYEKYVPMSSVKEEKKIIPRFIPMKQFSATYQQYVASGMDKDSLFSAEFTSLEEGSKINVELTSIEGLCNINAHKNPVTNIVPFDENRVVLDSQYFECDYINASYVNDYQFIATMHPTKATHRDFLQMIYQTETSMVIMLTTRKEKAKIITKVSNRVCYWPKKDEIIECEPFVTTLINSTETTAFLKQEISLKNTLEGKEHTFTQCILSIWNEDSTVAEMSPTLVLLSRILKQLQDHSSKSIIIHCEDGISKTGIMLTAISSVKELTLKKTINIFNAVKNLRKQRMKMVPTLACYVTCYSLMNEYCSIHH